MKHLDGVYINWNFDFQQILNFRKRIVEADSIIKNSISFRYISGIYSVTKMYKKVNK